MFKRGARVFAVMALGLGVAAAAQSARVTTDKGAVEGTLTADGKVVAFKGIPYAVPPVGDLRWKPPVPATRWTGVRAAKAFGAHCVQSATYNDMQFHDPGPSEDCLTLNVWTPMGAKPGSLPVMVWVYGGGYVTGGTSENRQDGQFLARRDVVVVSMNYRLGIFGFFVHPGLTAESTHHASGNYGLMDMTAALEWVKTNIRQFGGDARNITIFGESAGSFAVSTLMASPVSEGLVSKAIGESGGAFYSGGLGYQTRDAREKTDAAWAEKAFGTADIGKLREVSTEDVVRAATAKTTPAPPRFGPDVDGYFLPEAVPAIYAAGRQAHIPVMAGWNADEGRGGVVNSKTPVNSETLAALGEKDFPGRGKDFVVVYGGANDADAMAGTGDYLGDKFIAYSTWRWLEAQVKTGKAPVYRYFFTLGSPGDRNHAAALGAFHSDDIEYVFGALDSRPEAVWRAEDRRLSDQMMRYWTNFARTGDPNGADLPRWPAYGPTEWETMVLSGDTHAMPDSRRPRYVFLDSIWGRP